MYPQLTLVHYSLQSEGLLLELLHLIHGCSLQHYSASHAKKHVCMIDMHHIYHISLDFCSFLFYMRFVPHCPALSNTTHHVKM